MLWVSRNLEFFRCNCISRWALAPVFPCKTRSVEETGANARRLIYRTICSYLLSDSRCRIRQYSTLLRDWRSSWRIVCKCPRRYPRFTDSTYSGTAASRLTKRPTPAVPHKINTESLECQFDQTTRNTTAGSVMAATGYSR